jgi:hypothetical protein
MQGQAPGLMTSRCAAQWEERGRGAGDGGASGAGGGGEERRRVAVVDVGSSETSDSPGKEAPGEADGKGARGCRRAMECSSRLSERVRMRRGQGQDQDEGAEGETRPSQERRLAFGGSRID